MLSAGIKKQNPGGSLSPGFLFSLAPFNTGERGADATSAIPVRQSDRYRLQISAIPAAKCGFFVPAIQQRETPEVGPSGASMPFRSETFEAKVNAINLGRKFHQTDR